VPEPRSCASTPARQRWDCPAADVPHHSQEDSFEMPIFTLEVSGRPVLVFSEDDRSAAADLVASTIGPDLMSFEDEAGNPIWNGEEELLVRDAEPAEATRWELGRAEAQQDDTLDEQDSDGFAVFLVDVDDAEGE
jgi:hypothetical protein